MPDNNEQEQDRHRFNCLDYDPVILTEPNKDVCMKLLL